MKLSTHSLSKLHIVKVIVKGNLGYFIFRIKAKTTKELGYKIDLIFEHFVKNSNMIVIIKPIKMCWTCCNYCTVQHNFYFTARIHMQWVKIKRLYLYNLNKCKKIVRVKWVRFLGLFAYVDQQNSKKNL